VPVEEEQRRQRLVVRPRADLALERQVAQELPDLGFGQVPWVLSSVEVDERFTQRAYTSSVRGL